MATLILAGLGSAAGGAIGGTFLGVSAAVIGQSIGAVIGSAIDNYLFAPSLKFTQEGPRLNDIPVLTSSEGQPILRGYGRFRASGNLIWATRFREEVVKESTKQGGKGGGGATTTTVTYNYFANFAVGLCEGQIQDVHRIWADGKLMDLSDVTFRVYRGTSNQTPDSLITMKEGAGNAPGYRDLAYIVFEDLQINKYGNRIPQLSFEVTRPINRTDNNSVSDLITGIDLIPGTTEFGYDPDVIDQVIYGDDEEEDVTERRVENNHDRPNESGWKLALDQLQENLPNCGIVTFVVTWFGDDLRIGNCTIRPKVETREKRTDPISWQVAGLSRSSAMLISQYNGRPAFGGSPNDVSVYKAIKDLKLRGFEVMLYPFIIMDIGHGNSLPNPYSDNGTGQGQAVYPWRGRITCSPAIGYSGSVDKTAAARTQVNTFLGNAQASHFSGSGGTVNAGSSNSDWGFNRFVLHMAELCRQAGGVDYFCIGTEMIGASIIRDQSNGFPFVDGLINLADEVSDLLPSAKIGYAADWSEYHSYKPNDGTGDIYFNLDPLWANSNIDFIGIDNYMKLSDWRDGSGHADYGEGGDEYGNPKGESIYDLNYLKGQIEGGEDYDYYYASANDRATQTRTAIDDTNTANEDWVFRQKDIKNWWRSAHHNRPAGSRSSSSTAWQPQSKPILFTEYGCPALNKGTNQPNVFYDPKSSESFVPYFSSGARDDEIQRQYIRAMIEYWDPANGNNPVSTVYGDNMLDHNRMCYWSYDARPWPTFPIDGDAWADQPNWQYGHWISGRIDTVYMPDLLRALAEDYMLTADYDFSKAYGSCDGFVVQSKTSFRSTVEPLATLFMFDIIESGDTFKAVSEQEVRSLITLDLDKIADRSKNNEPVTFTRKQETELPAEISLRYIDIFANYESASVTQRREVVEATGSPMTDAPIVIDHARAQQLVDRLLYSAWAKRTEAELGVMPEFIYLETGDVITLNFNGFQRSVRIETVADGPYRRIKARSFDLGIFEVGGDEGRSQPINVQPVASSALIEIMDLPLLRSIDIEFQPYVASYVNPWPGVSLYKSITTSNYGLDTLLVQPAIIGETISVFRRGVTDVWDNANELDVNIYSEQLSSLDEESVFNNGNALAIENSSGEWEIIQFVNATMTGQGSYKLTRLLRGQLGTEDNMEDALPAGARIVVIDSTLQQVQLGIDDIGREYNYRYGPSNRDLGHETYRTIQKTVNGRGYKPFSPVHVRAEKTGDDHTFSWIRRNRIGGDNWNYTDDIPMSETVEQYEVDVLNSSGEAVRTLSVTDLTSVTYTSAQRTQDGINAPFDIKVYQISSQIGRGTGRTITVED